MVSRDTDCLSAGSRLSGEVGGSEGCPFRLCPRVSCDPLPIPLGIPSRRMAYRSRCQLRPVGTDSDPCRGSCFPSPTLRQHDGGRSSSPEQWYYIFCP